MQYVAAEPIIRAKEIRDEGSAVEIVVWRVRCLYSRVRIRTSTAFTSAPVGTAGYATTTSAARATIDTYGAEEPYRFVSLAQLLDDFERDVDNWT